ncbi:N-(5'-phosphoribosyl)anthranilate isomerase [Candidatus Kinetoplastibacterium sorsogonicusi]|uniref:N-(5'-phosphoribosyl)anthranilate isomerase n=1 Tax=Candidatus Kinetoplastidibacterium kentomonadis TaxID=1576550 RepID=A0A3Q8EU13_9PROT|nr:phosphoribosylanthranilate isomerase [Candidatus Kinetoplastibacterium sorsogonicusi]AWD32339.1 N-(5'-phosphoribosyl)anthranilate isomerase [Candidatus Kinetoplastibacterium sorsogonicusi]
MKRTRVKICGFTEENDIYEAVKIGIDAIGIVFYEKSKRFVDINKAIKLRKEIPIFVNCVALFVNATKDFIMKVQDKVCPDILQFHGDIESQQFCESFHQKFIRAIRIGSDHLNSTEQIYLECKKYNNASGILFDSYTNNYGGSGKIFQHDLIKNLDKKINCPIILSGGINHDNLETAIKNIQPWAIDVSSGVESSCGIKSKNKMKDLISKLYHIDINNSRL